MIRDEQQFVIKNARYDFVISDANGKVLIDQRNQTTTLGQGTHEVSFGSSGTAHITVKCRGSLGSMESGMADKAEFDLIVVPEFPVSVMIIFSTAVSVMIIARLMPKLQI